MSDETIREISNISIVVANIIDKSGKLSTDTLHTTKLPSNYQIYTNNKGEIYIFNDGTKKTLISQKTYNKLCSQLCPKEKHHTIKTTFAILVMIFVAYLIGELSVRWYNFCLDIIKDATKLSLPLTILIFILCGTSIPAMLLGAPFYGAILTVNISNTIIDSKKGLRYLIFGLFWLVLYGLNLIASIVTNEFRSAYVIPVLFGMALILFSKSKNIEL